MNKEKFVEKLSKELNYSLKQCTLINEILENNFIISRKSKDAIINELISQLDVDINEADNIYNASVSIITSEIKEKLKHPFKSQD
ncbi:MAG: hypothetical protein J1F35_07615 [Erysipelotrichales bacterium]|nr:hypothetical protein [Erysipelotrichales bacterium]